METTGSESTGTELVVYSKFTREIAKVVQKTASLDELRPENRVAVPGGMFVASCADLQIKPEGFLGVLVLSFFEEVAAEDSETPRPEDLMGRMMRRFLPQKGKETVKFDLTHEGKNYRIAWRVRSHDVRSRGWITLGGKPQKEVVGLVKTEAIARQKLLIANEFFADLFSPILNALLNLHTEMGQF